MTDVSIFKSSVTYSVDNYKGKNYSVTYDTDHNASYTDTIVICDGEIIDDMNLIDELDNIIQVHTASKEV